MRRHVAALAAVGVLAGAGGATATVQNPFKHAGGYAAVLARLIAPGLNGPAVKPGSFGGLQWGGQVFRTQAKFMSYLSARGGALGTFAIQHPAAYTLFETEVSK